MNECKYIITWYGEEKGSYFSRRFEKKVVISDIDIQRFYVDSHDDIHVKGCWGKSIIENRLNR